MSDAPIWMYGTAWKEERTTALTLAAVRAGFRAIDTACQPKHYQEALVGQALLQLRDEGITRDQLFLQTKFTPIDGHDQRVPYDPSAPLAQQVQQSFACSQKQLHTEHLDAYLLHGPYTRRGLSDSDWQVWRAIEALYDDGKIGKIGVSNVSFEQLQLFVKEATHPPMLVQNRCYAVMGWDREVREFCQKQGIIYQGFSLLTANRPVWNHPWIAELAEKYDATPAQLLYRFSQQVGMLPLTGTTDPTHMAEALACVEFSLSDEELQQIESCAG